MFTGIVQYRGRVKDAIDVEFGQKIVIDADHWQHKPDHGESISVSGVCLTCTSYKGLLAFDVIAQTLRNTTLGDLKPGDAVNLEPCVTPTSLMGGHFVQGHVDGVGEVINRHETPDEVRLKIKPPEHLMQYIIPRGSITTDGVSMTLAETFDDAFELALIPTTIDLTTLGLVQPGDRVNLEGDMIVKTIIHTMKMMRDDSGSDIPVIDPAGTWDMTNT